jgi:hypothetical protein
VAVERSGGIVLGVIGEGAHADDIGDLEGTPQRVEQQTGTEALALGLYMD